MKPFWIDIKGNKYNKEDIDDRYLKNIIGYLRKGGLGYEKFASLEVTKNILNEAINRNILTVSTANSIYDDIVELRNEIKEFKNNILNSWIDSIIDDNYLNQ